MKPTRSTYLATFAALVLAASACSDDGDDGDGGAAGEYPRAETLYTSGTEWGPPSTWNPPDEQGWSRDVGPPGTGRELDPTRR
jgi:hypothetical protein